ncbi:hypothetical protein MNBD_NITROSPINAE02-365 [hydrothermal vent metagenome]|uniref:VanZ-like domain-containing protein n=1 Tax=hydrothermal vent metagenome TaxID=652676 RepID=A0A3B1C798_9ZZZZ
MISQVAAKTIAITLLCAVTIPLLTLYDRFEPAGPQLLADPAFNNALKSWNARGAAQLAKDESGVATLSLEKNSTSASISQTIKNPGPDRYFTFSGEIKTENISKTGKPSYVARLLFISFGENGEALWALPHRLATLEGSNEWSRYEKTFRIYKMVKKVRAGAWLHKATGRIWVKNLSLRQARERSGYITARYLAMIAWALMALWIAPSFISVKEFRLSSFILALTGACIIGGILMPKEALVDMVSLIDKSLPGIRDYTGSIFSNGGSDNGLSGVKPDFGEIVGAVYSLTHFFFFLLIGLMAFIVKPEIPIPKALGYLVLFSVATETMQLFTAGREFSFDDMLLNLAGVGAALFIYLFIRKITRK